MPQWSKKLAHSIRDRLLQVYETGIQIHDFSLQITSPYMILLVGFAYGVFVYLMESKPEGAKSSSSQALKRGLSVVGISGLLLLLLPSFLHILFPFYFGIGAIDVLQRKYFPNRSQLQNNVQKWSQQGALFAMRNGIKMAVKGFRMLYLNH